MDPRAVNGGVFTGLNGIVIKSHGGTDEIGYNSALGLAYEMARSNLIEKIGDSMRRFPVNIAASEPSSDPEAKSA
jgi:glycerol-3-phosphate acyltransferase PlsX